MDNTTIRVDIRGEATPAVIWHGSYRLLTLGLLLTVVVFAFETLSVATTMPATVQDLGGLRWYGWVFSAYMLMMIIGITIAGSETDRLGPRRPYLAGGTLFVVGLTAAGLTPSMPLLIAARAVQGLGAGLLASIAYIVVGRSYPEVARPRMLALISSAYVIPSLVGPALAGLIADHLGWRWVFLGLAPALPLTAPFLLPTLRRLEPRAAPPRFEQGVVPQPLGQGVVPQRRDWTRMWAAVRIAAGSGLLVGGMGLHQTIVLTILMVGVGLGLILPALRHLVPGGAAPANYLPVVLLSGLLLNMAFFGVDAFVPLALTTVRSQTATLAGLALTGATLGWTASAWLQSHLVARQSRSLLVGAGVGLIMVGVGGAAALLHADFPVVLAPIAWGIAGMGMGLASPTLTLLALELVPENLQGASTSAMQLAGILGISLGTGIGGAIVGHSGSGSSAAAASIAGLDLIMIGVLLIALWVARRLPGQPATSAGAGEAVAVI